MQAHHTTERTPTVDGRIRPYKPEDREAVRRLVISCADTGIFPRCLHHRHQESLTDLLSRYYLDHEPESCWVVDSTSDGVVGYVFGCLSSELRRRVLFTRIVPSSLAKMLLRGALFTCPIPRLIWAGLSTWLRGRREKRTAQARFPGHLHVGLDPRYRRLGLGSRLVQCFLHRAQQCGVSGVHVSVVEGNAPAVAFFRGIGFQTIGWYTAFFPGSWARVEMLLLGVAAPDSALEAACANALEAPGRRTGRFEAARRQLARLRRWRRLKVPLRALESLVSVITGIPIYLQTPFLWFVSMERGVIPGTQQSGTERILVVAPHPDDDILGVGGTLADARSAGASVVVVYLTSGDANRAAKHLTSLHPFRLAAGYRALGARREREAVLALRHLGVPAHHALFLNYPDRGLTPMLDRHPVAGVPYRSRFTDQACAYSEFAYAPFAPYCAETLLHTLEQILGRFQPTVLYLPHPYDAHPDHRAGHQAIHIALQRAYASFPEISTPDMRSYIVHVFEERWPLPGGRHIAMPLSLVPESMANEPWVSTPLSGEAVTAKLAAIRSHASQWLTSRRFLAGFVRTNEIYAQTDAASNPSHLTDR